MAKDLLKVAPDYPTIRQLFETQIIQDQLKMAAASTVRIDQLARVFLSVIRNSDKLLKSTQQSLLTCLFAFAQLGLSPEPFLGQAYPVPFWNGGLKAFEAQFIPGYRGMIVLARRSGELSNLVAQNVFENDNFKIRFGLHEILEHAPAMDKDRGKFLGSWTKFTYHRGDATFEFMSISDIDRIKARSKSRDQKGNIVGPWVTDYEEMAKKTVIKRHMKLAPLSVEDHSLARAAYAEDLAMDGRSQSGLFLPDSEDRPIEVEFRDFDQEFNSIFGDDQGEISGLMISYLDAVSKGNKKPMVEIKQSAVENQDEFLRFFELWKSNQAPAEDKPGPKTKAKKKDSASSKKRQGDDKGKSEKTAPEDNELGSDGQNEGDQGETGEESLLSLEETNEYQELQVLKMQYPKFYLKTLKGQTPTTMAQLNKAIDGINKMITESGGDGIPGA